MWKVAKKVATHPRRVFFLNSSDSLSLRCENIRTRKNITSLSRNDSMMDLCQEIIVINLNSVEYFYAVYLKGKETEINYNE